MSASRHESEVEIKQKCFLLTHADKAARLIGKI